MDDQNRLVGTNVHDLMWNGEYKRAEEAVQNIVTPEVYTDTNEQFDTSDMQGLLQTAETSRGQSLETQTPRSLNEETRDQV